MTWIRVWEAWNSAETDTRHYVGKLRTDFDELLRSDDALPKDRVTTLQTLSKFPDISLTMCGTHAHVKWYS